MTTAAYTSLATAESATVLACLILAVCAVATLGVVCALVDSWNRKGDHK